MFKPILVPSANMEVKTKFELDILVIYNTNRRGPSMDPYGTPDNTLHTLLYFLFSALKIVIKSI